MECPTKPDEWKEYCDILGYGKNAIDFLKENYGYLAERNGEIFPTAVTLLFDKNPQNFLPRAQVRFIRFDGTEEKVGAQMNVIKDRTFKGTIRQQIEKTVEYLGTQIKEHTYLAPDAKFTTDKEYPDFVLQEMIVNACCHRDYSIVGTEIQVKLFDDRLVVESPGGLPGRVRTDNIRHTHFSRNQRIAAYLKAYKYVKEFGEGVDRMCREMEEMGGYPIRYTRHDFILLASAVSRFKDLKDDIHLQSIDNNRVKEKNEPINEPINDSIRIANRHKKIVAIMKKDPDIDRIEIAKKLKVSLPTIKRDIIELQKLGIVSREGARKNGRWIVLKEV